VAIVAPATIVKSEYVDGAAKAIAARGFVPRVMPHAKGPACGSYAACGEARLADIIDALSDDSVQAILCARGGYGCVHLLEDIPEQLVASAAKWLIGFSDISALHALWHKAGVVSLHAPMAKHLTLLPPDDECTQLLFNIITSPSPEMRYTLPTAPGSQPGKASGRLLGGNLAVLSHLIATPWDMLSCHEQTILIIEDVGEAIYATERMLWQLKLSGALERVCGIVAGRFTEAKPDHNFSSTSRMIAQRLREWGVTCPVAIDFPVGHTDRNLPLMLGARATLEVNDNNTSLFAD